MTVRYRLERRERISVTLARKREREHPTPRRKTATKDHGWDATNRSSRSFLFGDCVARVIEKMAPPPGPHVGVEHGDLWKPFLSRTNNTNGRCRDETRKNDFDERRSLCLPRCAGTSARSWPLSGPRRTRRRCNILCFFFASFERERKAMMCV